jgi:hypothetical protein
LGVAAAERRETALVRRVAVVCAHVFTPAAPGGVEKNVRKLFHAESL